jgi:hypothetical protein
MSVIGICFATVGISPGLESGELLLAAEDFVPETEEIIQQLRRVGEDELEVVVEGVQ